MFSLQRFIIILTDHLAKCEGEGIDYQTPWYKWIIERLQEVFLLVRTEVKIVCTGQPRYNTLSGCINSDRVIDESHSGFCHDWSSPTVYEGISKSFEPNMERARNLDLFCFIFQRSPLPTPHTCPI